MSEIEYFAKSMATLHWDRSWPYSVATKRKFHSESIAKLLLVLRRQHGGVHQMEKFGKAARKVQSFQGLNCFVSPGLRPPRCRRTWS